MFQRVLTETEGVPLLMLTPAYEIYGIQRETLIYNLRSFRIRAHARPGPGPRHCPTRSGVAAGNVDPECAWRLQGWTRQTQFKAGHSKKAWCRQSRQTLRGLKFIICIFIFSRSVPKTQSTHEWDLDLVSGSDFLCNLHHFSSRGRSRGSRSPPGAPEGRK